MKLSVSLPDDDVAFLDHYVRTHGVRSRSAAVHEALRLLRDRSLAQAYEAAWEEWGDEEAVWEVATGDGIDAA
jgi:Arc/MetJ-type ribon-helix-helix transcriptional regulator